MPTDPDNSSNETDERFHHKLNSDLEFIRAQLADLESRRQRLLEAELRRRAEVAAAHDKESPGIPE